MAYFSQSSHRVERFVFLLQIALSKELSKISVYCAALTFISHRYLHFTFKEKYGTKPGWKSSEIEKYMWVGLKEGTNIDETFLLFCYATKNELKSCIFTHLLIILEKKAWKKLFQHNKL